MFALLTTTACALVFGSAPAWQASRVDINETLRHSGRTSVGSGRRRLRQGLVLAELALAVTSLAGAGLAMHSFWNRMQVDLGVQTEGTLTFSLPVTGDQLNTRERIESFYRQLLERLRTVPGVTHASLSVPVPLQGTPLGMPFHLGGTPPCTTACPDAVVRVATPGFFETFGGVVVHGRAFTDDDKAGGVRVALVSEQFAARYLPDVDPLRQQIEVNEPAPGRHVQIPRVEWQIVGVYRTINNTQELGDVSRPEVILPFWQSPVIDAGVAVRTAGEPAAVRNDVAAAVRSIDPDLPLVNVRTMTEIVRERFASDRRNVALYGGLAAVALLLAALGVYGVMAFSVAQRTPEIGLRIALGAGREPRAPANSARRLDARRRRPRGGRRRCLRAGPRDAEHAVRDRGDQRAGAAGRRRGAPRVCAARVLRPRAPRKRHRSDDCPAAGIEQQYQMMRGRKARSAFLLPSYAYAMAAT